MASVDQQLHSMYEKVIASRGGVLVGSGRRKMRKGRGLGSGGGKYRSCDVISASGPSGKERCVRYVRHSKPPLSAKQMRWQQELANYRQATGASLKQAMIALRR